MSNVQKHGFSAQGHGSVDFGLYCGNTIMNDVQGCLLNDLAGLLFSIISWHGKNYNSGFLLF